MNPEEFEIFFQPHRQPVVRIVSRILRQRPNDVEDVVQEVALNVFEKIDGFEARASLKTWIYTIAHNKAVDYIRKTRLEYQLPSETLEIPDTKSAPRYALRDRTDLLLHKVIEMLSREQKELIHLRFFKGLSIEEMAAVLGVPNGTIQSRLSRTLSDIREDRKFRKFRNAWGLRGAVTVTNPVRDVVRPLRPQSTAGAPAI